MLCKSTHLFVGYTLLFFSALLQAEISKDRLNTDAHRITLRDAIKKTLEHNPALNSYRYQLKAQQGLQTQAGTAASPELKFMIEDALGTGDFKAANKTQATLSISWVVEGNIRQGYIDEASAGTLLLTTEASIKRLDAAAETARLFLVCLANQARLINAAKNVGLADETIIAVNQRVQAGKTSEAELARAEADRERKRLDREDLEHGLRSATRLLAAQWGETDPKFTRVEGDIFGLPKPLSFEVLKSRLQQSPEFLRLMSDRRLKQAQLKLQESLGRPAWRVNLGLRHFETTKDQALVAGINIPFGERARNTGRISAAREKLSQTQASQVELSVRLETTLFILSEDLQHSLHRVDAYRSRIIPRLETALKQTRRAYELGRYSYLEWRSVQVELLNARTALIEDSIDVHIKVIEIERLIGISMLKPTDKK
ncbi:MAG: TolC family protein [Thiohalomonadales bacterium]